MKRKSAPKSATPKTHHRVKKNSNNGVVKIVLMVAAALVLLFLAPPTKGPLANALARTGLFSGSATVSWPKVDGAVYYNIYYKQTTDPDFVYSVRNIPPEATEHTISHLKRGWTYQYKISAVDSSGKEFMWTTFQDAPNPM